MAVSETSAMTLTSFDARTGSSEPAGAETAAPAVDVTIVAAQQAAATLAATAPRQRAQWWRAIAVALRANSDRLAELADRETALGLPRLTGEVERAASQWEWYTDEANTGRYLEVIGSDPIVRVGQTLGVVGVFGASNFPFAFGLVGNDTASALAAGCPVVAKHHPAHPRTSEALAQVVQQALAEAGAPAGTFAAVAGFEAGQRLVTHPGIAAVAFTGSQRGGMALWRLAAEREVVIPVFAEMGTVNPVVMTAGALARAEEVARGFVDSFTLGAGQFCTKPGLLLAPPGSAMADRVGRALQAAAPEPVMLTETIAESAHAGLKELLAAGAELVAQSGSTGPGWRAPAAVLAIRPEDLLGGGRMLEECFGPIALVCEVAEPQIPQVLAAMQGALCGAVQGGADDPQVPDLVALLAAKVGRVIVNGWPTGVLTSAAQHHGGPWPATTRPEATSVGGGALARFVRPVAYQNCEPEAVPPAGRRSNPWQIEQVWR